MAGLRRSWRRGRSAVALCGGAQSGASQWSPCSPASVEVQPEAQARVWADATAAEGSPLKVVGSQDDETTSCSSVDAHSPASSATMQAPMKVEHFEDLPDGPEEQEGEEWTKVEHNAELSDDQNTEDETAMTCTSSLCTTHAEAASSDEEVTSDSDVSFRVEASGEALSVGFACVIARMAKMAADPESPTCFHAVRAPAISMLDYMERIHQYFYCSDMCFVLAFVYINRLITSQADMILTPLSSHRLVLTSMMVAAKFHDDVYYANAMYSKVGGVRTKELNSLEARFVTLLDWRLQVSPEDYKFYRDLLMAAGHPAPDSPQGLGPPGVCG